MAIARHRGACARAVVEAMIISSAPYADRDASWPPGNGVTGSLFFRGRGIVASSMKSGGVNRRADRRREEAVRRRRRDVIWAFAPYRHVKSK